MLKFEHFAFLDPGVGELPLPCVQFDVFLLSLAVIVMRIQSFTEDDDDDDDDNECLLSTMQSCANFQQDVCDALKVQNQAPKEGTLERE